MKNIICIIATIIFVSSCTDNSLSKVSDDQFIGIWLLESNNILNGLEIEISINEKNELIGVVAKLNDDKYVNLFLEIGDLFITQIKRKSNFEFIISQKKLASPLFSLYDQSTTANYAASFDENGNIQLGNKGSSGSLIKKH